MSKSRKVIFLREDFFNWAIINKSVYKRIGELIKDMIRQPLEGIGKPEPLKHNLSGCWSRRITDAHRLVYRVDKDENLEIVSCKGHY